MPLLTQTLLIVAILATGVLAGSYIDRAFVGLPAWQWLGPEVWAAYSRHADLGVGLVLYPLAAIGGALLTLAAAVSFHFDRSASREAAWPLYAAVVLSAAGLGLTLMAAPIMLGLPGVTDPAALRRSFEAFYFWSHWRGACQTLAFAFQLWALATLGPNGQP